MESKIENRIEEMASSFEGCVKEAYLKEEVLPELLKLQSEMVAIAFPEKTAEERDELRLWDIERHMDDLSEKRQGKAREEIEAFKDSCKIVGNLIAAEVSGMRGEKMAFRKLARFGSAVPIVRNLEVERDGYRTEMDDVVLTKKGAIIIEVKNTHRDVFIDEEGNAYRTGRFMRHDCNLLGKMEMRKNILSKMLADAGYPNVTIKGIVVYTNERIEVQNRCDALTVSFLPQLPYLIEEHEGNAAYEADDLEHMRIALEEMGSRETYPIRFDMELFKRQFASAVITLSLPDEKAKATPRAAITAILRKVASLIDDAGASHIPATA